MIWESSDDGCAFQGGSSLEFYNAEEEFREWEQFVGDGDAVQLVLQASAEMSHESGEESDLLAHTLLQRVLSRKKYQRILRSIDSSEKLERWEKQCPRAMRIALWRHQCKEAIKKVLHLFGTVLGHSQEKSPKP